MKQGSEFEFAIARLYDKMGFAVETNKLIEGKSGSTHEIDVYAVKKGLRKREEVAVECKYRKSRSVGKLDLANFLLTLDDTRIEEGHMVTNSSYSENATKLAENYKIKLVDGDELVGLFKKHKLDFYFHSAPKDAFSYLIRRAVNVLDDTGLFEPFLKRRRRTKSSINRKLNLGNSKSSGDRSPNKISESLEKSEDDPEGIRELVLVERPNKYFGRDIGGLYKVKDQLKVAVIYPRTNPEIYSRYDKKPGSVLLYGPPGCGKTLLAKAVATETNGEFIAPKISDIMKRYVGQSERMVTSIFEYARNECRNPIFFMDELESVMSRSGPSYAQRIKNEFLEQMDGVFEGRKISIMGATNRPWRIDVAIRRPGRFNKMIFVPPPDLFARKEILRIHMRGLVDNRMINEDVNEIVDFLAPKTEGWSGDDLRQLVEDSKDKAILNSIKGKGFEKLTKSDFERVLSSRKPSTKPWFKDAIRSCKRYGENELLKEIKEYKPS